MIISKERYETIDFIRGIALINMIAFHGMFDLVYIFGIKIPWFSSEGAYFWQQMICTSFIFIAGVSAGFSRNILKNGCKVFGGGLVISLVTMVAMPSQFVSFGILHLLGMSMILFSFIRKYIDKVSPIVTFLLSIGLFLLTKKVPAGYLGIGDIKLFQLPSTLYENDFFFAIGFPSHSFESADYFPMIPWLFLFLAGYSCWNVVKKSKPIQKYGHFQVKGINSLGKHSFAIYLLHQPVLYGALFILDKLL